MIGSFLTRGFIMVLGYAYPAFECYKTVENNKANIEQLRFWCQYWILVALLTAFEKFGDTLISWIPMYAEAKLAFFIYLWCPKTKGATYVYDSFLCPYLTKHEKEIDRNLLELKTRAADITYLYWQKAATYGQSRVFEVLQYFAAHSSPKPRTVQQQQVPEAQEVPATIKQQPQQPPSLPSNNGKAPVQHGATQEVIPPASPSISTSTSTSTSTTSSQAIVAYKDSKEVTSQNKQNEVEEMKIEAVSSLSKGNVNPAPQPQDTVMEETIRVTRARLRKNRSTEKH